VIKTLKNAAIKPFVRDAEALSSADLHQVTDVVSLRKIEAGNLAFDVFAGKGVTYSALKALYGAIPKVPTYARPCSIYNYNGLA
jgi:hypothetical protein